MFSKSVQLIIPIIFGADMIGVSAAEHKLPPNVASYFKQYCYRCHGESNQKGDRRLDLLPSRLEADSDAATLLEEALDAINRGDMPPAKKGVTQPPEDETRRVVELITDYLSKLSDADAVQATMMRRLNRFEYVNTMRDLLGLRREFFDFTSDFPIDATEHGFDNNGEALTLSDHQLQRYLEVAEASLDAASFFGVERAETQQWNYTGRDFNGVRSYERAPVTWRLIVNDEYMEIGHGQPSERHANFAPAFVREGGVPADGWYSISVKAAAANRLDHGYDHDEFDRFKSQRLKLALWIAPNVNLLGKNAADQRQLLHVWDLHDGKAEVFTQRVWLNKGAIPFVSWTNGISSKGNIRRVAEKHHPEVIRATTTQLDAAKLGDPEAQALVAKLAKNANNKLLSEVYHGPCVRIWSMDIEGPEFKQWPPASHQLLFGNETDASKIDINQTVVNFARRAFRRPVSSDEVGHYVKYISDLVDSGVSPADAIKRGFAAILTSPRFLYLDEGNEEADSKLTAYELATRLSYFLWSSMPDEELLAAAESGELTTRDGLAVQVERMLNAPLSLNATPFHPPAERVGRGSGRGGPVSAKRQNDQTKTSELSPPRVVVPPPRPSQKEGEENGRKSDAFVEHFTDTWLRINTLGSMPPDPKAFETYYRDRLEELFKKETRLFFRDLLESNRSIENLLDSNYTFVNDSLASHYRISDVKGEHFRKVTLQPEHRRGGLLGQGSILTLSANGIETSPVVRGIWVLENILGTPPPPPPPDVPAIEPDTRGTTTIREQLDKHRNVADCADCHRKIDPAGFALEFFDPIGGFRTHYPGRGRNRPAVDGSGQLPTGETFTDERGLKKLLIARKDRFTEALTEKLLAYATGRSMTFRDQPEIKRIASESATSGYGLRDLILRVATSQTFRNR